jgi:hypothetical protein
MIKIIRCMFRCKHTCVLADAASHLGGAKEALLMLLLSAAVQIVARVRAGPALVHGYSVFEQNEFWAHSDAE